MTERSRLSNGRFLHDLSNWTASSASYSAGDGDEHFGVAVLADGGGYVEQDFTVPLLRAYSLHLAYKCANQITSGLATAVITDGNGNTVATILPVGFAAQWNEKTQKLGLAPGTTYTIRISNVSAGSDVKIDDVWLWFVPITRAEMAEQVHEKLARLASNRSLSTAAIGAKTEGDYTAGVDAGLRGVGAINPETGEVDVRYLDDQTVKTALDLIEHEMLERLQRDYAVEVDTQAGPVRESLSQINRAIEQMTGTSRTAGQGGASGPVIVRKLRHEAEDYEL